MRASIIVFMLCLVSLHTTAAESPAAALVTPPPTAQQFTIMSTAGNHGTSARWTTDDGTRMGRESLLLRGQVFELESAARLGADGMLTHVVVRGHTPNGDAAETFTINDGVAAWKSPVDEGSSPYRTPAQYLSFGGPFALGASVFEALLAAPDRSLAWLPGGRAHAEMLTTAEALTSATIAPARVVNADTRTGSIEAGKAAGAES